ncbi:MAG TPA: VWA domain-containing protein, partial [Thermoanaerobaculia bacterium]|nr:VWA domain-containing protein [Thermoanaerobaculia bacterium]
MKRTLFAIAIAFSLQAQRYDERVTVNVIEVPVNVTRNGHAVRGLTIDDFELFVNGARQKIEYFDVVDDGEVPESVLPAAANAENAPSPLQRRTMTVLLFDTTMTQSYLVNRAKAAAEKFVAEAGPNDTFSVARLGRDGVQFVVPFTRDHVAVRRAVATLAPSRAGDAFGLATLQSELGAVQTALSVEEPGYGHAFESADYGQWQKPAAEFAQRAIKKMNAIEEERRDDDQDRMARHLGELADRLASISGVKHVAFLGEGMTKGANEFYATRMHERFQAAGVILDAIDLDGMRVPDYQTFGAGARASADMGRYLHPLHDKSSSLYMLA